MRRSINLIYEIQQQRLEQKGINTDIAHNNIITASITTMSPRTPTSEVAPIGQSIGSGRSAVSSKQIQRAERERDKHRPYVDIFLRDFRRLTPDDPEYNEANRRHRQAETNLQEAEAYLASLNERFEEQERSTAVRMPSCTPTSEAAPTATNTRPEPARPVPVNEVNVPDTSMEVLTRFLETKLQGMLDSQFAKASKAMTTKLQGIQDSMATATQLQGIKDSLKEIKTSRDKMQSDMDEVKAAAAATTAARMATTLKAKTTAFLMR